MFLDFFCDGVLDVHCSFVYSLMVLMISSMLWGLLRSMNLCGWERYGESFFLVFAFFTMSMWVTL